MKLVDNIIDKKKDLTHKLKIHIRKKAIKQFEKKTRIITKESF